MRCLSPILIKNEKVGLKSPYSHYVVPCGKCEACVKRKTNDWFVRLKYEQMSSGHVWFITLTYDQENLPVRIEDGKAYFDVSKEDCILFHKRLRKLLGPDSGYKYFLCSEYGGKYQRPHYHEIAFNLLPSQLPLIKDAWNKGLIEVSEANDNRLRYVCGYVIEKLFVPDGCKPVFNLISKGLGAKYVEKFRDYHSDIERMYVPLSGVKYHMPRYYKERLYNDGQRSLHALRCTDEAEKKRDEYIAEHGLHDLEVRNYEIRAQYAREVRQKRKKR